MCKNIWKATKVNLRNIKVPYFVTMLYFGFMLIQNVAQLAIARSGVDMSTNGEVSAGNSFYVLIVLAAIFIPAVNYSRIITLGGKRHYFLCGSLVTYGLLAIAASLANTAYHVVYDRYVIAAGYFDPNLFSGGVGNLMVVFGWTSHGIVVVFLQQTAFMFLLAVVVHTVTAIQGKWYGWVANALIVAIIALLVSTAGPSPALLALAILHHNALLQIISCLVLAFALYALSKPIFARKAI